MGLYEFATSSPFIFSDSLGLYVISDLVNKFGIDVAYEIIKHVSQGNFQAEIELSAGGLSIGGLSAGKVVTVYALISSLILNPLQSNGLTACEQQAMEYYILKQAIGKLFKGESLDSYEKLLLLNAGFDLKKDKGIANLSKEEFQKKFALCPPNPSTDSSGGGDHNNNTTIAGGEDDDQNKPKEIFPSIGASGKVPSGWKAIETKKVNIKNQQLLCELQKIKPGKWKKVYSKGTGGVEIHYFQHESGAVFNVKIK